MDNLLVDALCKICQKNSDKVALIDEKEHATYKELFSKAQKICSFLKDKVQHGDAVGIYMNKSVDYVIVLTALLLYGCIYVPIDKRNKKERLNYIVSASKCKLIVSDGSNMDYAQCPTYCFRDLLYADCDEYSPKVLSEMREEVYILFTSGSTGNPKGVKISYDNLWNLVNSLNERIYSPKEKDLRIAVVASFSFDASVKQIFFSLIFGHTLYIVPDKVKKFGRLLCNYLKTNRIDVCDFTPSLIATISKDKRCSSYLGLKKVLIGGELLFGKHLNCIRKLFGDQVNIVNLYGPTECCVDICYYIVPENSVYRDEEYVPVGLPLDNNVVFLNNHQEIIVQGANVGLGYTSEQRDSGYGFFNGKWGYNTRDIGFFDEQNRLVVLGRSDNQVKVNGYRIELEDIENNIYALKHVKYVKVFIYERRIIAVICSSNKSQKHYIEQLQQKLPEYMLPDLFIFDDDVKLNRNMKFDSDYYINLL